MALNSGGGQAGREFKSLAVVVEAAGELAGPITHWRWTRTVAGSVSSCW